MQTEKKNIPIFQGVGVKAGTNLTKFVNEWKLKPKAKGPVHKHCTLVSKALYPVSQGGLNPQF